MTSTSCKRLIFNPLLIALVACGCSSSQKPAIRLKSDDPLNRIAEHYVKLALAIGEHDKDYVDAYFGPAGWSKEMKSRQLSKDEIKKDAIQLLDELATIPVFKDEMTNLRTRFLKAQLKTLSARIDILQGVKLSFDQEAYALYGIRPPAYDLKEFDKYLKEIDQLLPSNGSLTARYQKFKEEYAIPRDRLDIIMQQAISACRERTKQFIALPENESFEIEFVTDKPWSAYNWYLGDYRSLIQINHEHSIFIGNALRLACHEGYPGHHVNISLLEKHLVKERGWVEFTVYPLYSQQSLIAEGTANYGIELAFPLEERVAFEREVLYPMAGLDPKKARRLLQIERILGKLRHAQIEIARRFLDREINVEQAIDQLEHYLLMTRDRAKRLIRFIETYRSYIANYTLGEDLVRAYMSRNNGDVLTRWKVFTQLISTPRLLNGQH